MISIPGQLQFHFARRHHKVHRLDSHKSCQKGALRLHPGPLVKKCLWGAQEFLIWRSIQVFILPLKEVLLITDNRSARSLKAEPLDKNPTLKRKVLPKNDLHQCCPEQISPT